jgi:hypothetical protein
MAWAKLRGYFLRVKNKTSSAKLAEKPQSPVFQKALHRLRPDSETATAGSKPPKRDNIFSQSRDTREDRSARQMKTSHNSQTLPHGR